MTYKHGSNWLSEIDLAICNSQLLECMEKFNVYTNNLPSDHRPIEISLNINLTYATLLDIHENSSKIGSYDNIIEKFKPIKAKDVDKQRFISNLPTVDSLTLGSTIDEQINSLNSIIYSTALT